MTSGKYAAALAVAGLVLGDMPVMAQQAVASGQPYLADSASPFGKPLDAGDAKAVTMPDLAFKSDGTADFDKYYAFRRVDTDYATAFADVSECDGYARGLQSGIGYTQTPYPYAGTRARLRFDQACTRHFPVTPALSRGPAALVEQKKRDPGSSPG